MNKTINKYDTEHKKNPTDIQPLDKLLQNATGLTILGSALLSSY